MYEYSYGSHNEHIIFGWLISCIVSTATSITLNNEFLLQVIVIHYCILPISLSLALLYKRIGSLYIYMLYLASLTRRFLSDLDRNITCVITSDARETMQFSVSENPGVATALQCSFDTWHLPATDCTDLSYSFCFSLLYFFLFSSSWEPRKIKITIVSSGGRRKETSCLFKGHIFGNTCLPWCVSWKNANWTRPYGVEWRPTTMFSGRHTGQLL